MRRARERGADRVARRARSSRWRATGTTTRPSTTRAGWSSWCRRGSRTRRQAPRAGARGRLVRRLRLRGDGARRLLRPPGRRGARERAEHDPGLHRRRASTRSSSRRPGSRTRSFSTAWSSSRSSAATAARACASDGGPARRDPRGAQGALRPAQVEARARGRARDDRARLQRGGRAPDRADRRPARLRVRRPPDAAPDAPDPRDRRLPAHAGGGRQADAEPDSRRRFFHEYETFVERNRTAFSFEDWALYLSSIVLSLGVGAYGAILLFSENESKQSEEVALVVDGHHRGADRVPDQPLLRGQARRDRGLTAT